MNSVILGQVYLLLVLILTLSLVVHQKKYVGQVLIKKSILSFFLWFIPPIGLIYFCLQLYRNVSGAYNQAAA